MNSPIAPGGSSLCMGRAGNASSSWSHSVTLQMGSEGGEQGCSGWVPGSSNDPARPPQSEKTDNEPHPPTAQPRAEKDNFPPLMLKACFGEDQTQKGQTYSYTGTYWQKEEWTAERNGERRRGIKRETGRGREKVTTTTKKTNTKKRHSKRKRVKRERIAKMKGRKNEKPSKNKSCLKGKRENARKVSLRNMHGES